MKEDSQKLKNKDIVKIEVGAHIDGFPAGCARTIVIGGKTKGKAADVTVAAYKAFQAACRTIKPGSSNHDVTKVIQ